LNNGSMITKKLDRSRGVVRVTFSLPRHQPAEPVWVVGDFNGWDEGAHAMMPRSNGRRSAVVDVGPGDRFAFRYRTASGHWFEDDQADEYEPNPHGSVNAVITT